MYNAPAIVETLVALCPPESPPVTDGVDQLYVVPPGIIPFIESEGVTANDAPLQIVVVIAVMLAAGLTETVSVNEMPTQ